MAIIKWNRYIRPGYNPIELDNLRPYLRKEKTKKIYGTLGKPIRNV